MVLNLSKNCMKMIDFVDVFLACENEAYVKFHRVEGYLFKENKLYMLQRSMSELLVRESHGRGLMGTLWCEKDLRCLS